jgi:ATP-binding cassette subfamily F protein 3
VGPGVIIGYLSQNHAELLAYTSAHHLLTSIEGVEETDAYKILSKVKIEPEHMKQDITTLSSGQKTKLLLARIMVTGANFIILDEPTNHLDIEAIEVIEQALAEFQGTLLVISHDRYFLNQIGITSYLLIEDQKLKRTSLHQKNRV